MGNAIEVAGLTENTLIIFASDNGPWITFQDTASHKKYGEACLHNRFEMAKGLPRKEDTAFPESFVGKGR